MEIRYYGDKISERIAKTPEGFLICQDVPISRTGFQKYLASELYDGPLHHDRIVPVYRPAKEVFDPRSLASFEGKPVTNEHPEEDVTPDNYARYACGHVQNVHIGEGEDAGKVLADLYITDPALIQLIKTGKREVSCGYYAEEKKDGEGRICQTKIRGNHVAVVDNGRAGNKVCIRDSNPFFGRRKKMRSRFRNYADALRYIDADDIMDEDVLLDEDIVEDDDILEDEDYLTDEDFEDDDYLTDEDFEDDDVVEDDDYLTDEDFEDDDYLTDEDFEDDDYLADEDFEDDDYVEDDDDYLTDEDFEDEDFLTDEDFITDAGVKGMKKGQHIKAKDPDYLRALKIAGGVAGAAAAGYGLHKLGGGNALRGAGIAAGFTGAAAKKAAGLVKSGAGKAWGGIKSGAGKAMNSTAAGRAYQTSRAYGAGVGESLKNAGGVARRSIATSASNLAGSIKSSKVGQTAREVGRRISQTKENLKYMPKDLKSRKYAISQGVRGKGLGDSMFGMRPYSCYALPYYDEDTLYDEDVLLDEDILEDDDYLTDDDILEDEDYISDEDYLTDEDFEDDDILEDEDFEDDDVIEDEDFEDEDYVEDDDYLTDEDELTLRADALLQDAKKSLKKAQRKLKKAKKGIKRRKKCDAEILNDEDFEDEDFEDEDYLVDEDYEDEDSLYEDEDVIEDEDILEDEDFEDEDFEDDDYVEDDDILEDEDALYDEDVIEDEDFEDEDITEDDDYVEDACLQDDESDTISIDKTKALRELSEASREISDPNERKQVQDTIYKTLCKKNQMTDVMNITKRNRAARLDSVGGGRNFVSFEQQQSIYDSFNPHKNKNI